MPGSHPEALKSQLALWVAAGGKVSGWCKKHNISLRTAYTWHRKDAFKRMVEEYRNRAVDRAIGRMARSLGKAVKKIIVLIEEGQTDSVKLSAAKTLVDKLIAVQNHAELKSDLRQLDERLGAEEERRARRTATHPKPARPA